MKVVIFGAKDAGPAAYLARVIGHFPGRYRCIGSGSSLPVFNSFKIRCAPGSMSGMDQVGLIMTGTCLGKGLDKELQELGRVGGIPTIAIVDHWTWMRERFEVDGTLHLPDIIFVNDDTARKYAIEAGIPGNKIAAIGNPVLEENPFPEKPSPSVRAGHAGNSRKEKHVVFVSEELSSAFPEGSEQYLGFSEYNVLYDILQALSVSDHLVIKLHPEESSDKYSSLVNRANCRVSIFRQCDTQALIMSADVVIGMGSMLLLEAARSRTDIVSYRPKETRPFIGNEIGVTHHARNADELFAIIHGRVTVKNQLLGDRFSGSLERILHFMENLLSNRFEACVS